MSVIMNIENFGLTLMKSISMLVVQEQEIQKNCVLRENGITIIFIYKGALQKFIVHLVIKILSSILFIFYCSRYVAYCSFR